MVHMPLRLTQESVVVSQAPQGDRQLALGSQVTCRRALQMASATAVAQAPLAAGIANFYRESGLPTLQVPATQCPGLPLAVVQMSLKVDGTHLSLVVSQVRQGPRQLVVVSHVTCVSEEANMEGLARESW